MRRALWLVLGLSAALLVLAAQQSDVIIKLTQGEKPGIAVPDFRGSGNAQPLMNAFNEVLFSDLESSGLFKMIPKSMYPLQVPQQPGDFREPPPQRPPERSRRGQLPQPPSGGGLWLSDWSSPPVSANYLAMGYTAVQNDVLVLYGWLMNVGQSNVASAQVFGKRYFGSVDEAGANTIAPEFAADIITQLGGKALLGSKIYFVSDRTGHKEVWSMEADGSNQKRITQYNSITIMPAVSPDGSKVAFTSFVKVYPAIFIFSVETGRPLRFYNQRASMNATPDFTPDGKHIVFSSTLSGWAQIYIADLDGGNLRRISSTRTIEVEPKVNPKTGTDLVYVGGPEPEQIYRMNLDGVNVERLTTGEGQATNPSWHPDGQIIAFSWTRGYEPGNFNLFLMDVATRSVTQLTHGEGRNENPTWAPDGRHLVFMSNRSGSRQIWTMLADGTQLRQLTTKGNNETPVWGR